MGADVAMDPVVDALRRWLEEHHRGAVAVPAVTTRDEGFDSVIHLVRFAGHTLPEPWTQPLVVRVKGDADRTAEAEWEARVQDWLADQGYPTPRVLAVFGAGELDERPLQVMERAPGVTMLDAVRKAPWRARRQLNLLGDLHVRLHDLAVEGFPDGEDLLDQRLALTRATVRTVDDRALADGLARVEALAPSLRDGPPTVCHGDFHPLNVLVAGTQGQVIDWTDAGVGDRHGDISRTLVLFDVAEIAATASFERRALRAAGPRLGRWYLRAYERARAVDMARVDRWRPVHLLHGWSQAMSLHAGLFVRDAGPDARTDRVPSAMVDELHRRFDDTLARVT